MNSFTSNVQLRWSDFDPNFHLRHSVYYDWGAMNRIEFLNNGGLTFEIMLEHGFGPIIFREECVFKKEIRPSDTVSIDLWLLKSRRDHSRWTIQHTIRKGDILSAVLTLDGAWIDVTKRKLTIPPDTALKVFDQMPRAESFCWDEKR